MKEYDKLNKKRAHINEKKTHVYRLIKSHEDLLDDVDVDCRANSLIDFYYLEVLVNALNNRKQILDAYDRFTCQDGGDLDMHLAYGERQRLFNQDLKPLLEEMPHFKTKTGDSIYIPCFKPEINIWYETDVQRVFLNKHKAIIDAQMIYLDTPEDIYGLSIFKTDFSSLIPVLETETQMTFYSIEFNTMFLFDRESKRCIDHLIVKEDKNEEKVNGKDLQIVAAYMLQEQLDPLLDYLYKRTFLDEKLYKRFRKK